MKLGQAGQKPLHFVSSYPRNGATGVSRTVRMRLTFDKNVVNDTVWSNNRRQIRLWRGSNRVSIYVTRVPDTVNFSLRRNIYVRPVYRLRSHTRYRIAIYSHLKSKAGVELGRNISIYFRTRI